jgi:hypothetical protein
MVGPSRPATEEVVELDEATQRWTERTISGGPTGTEITWQVLDDGPGAKLLFSAELRGKGDDAIPLAADPPRRSQGLGGSAAGLEASDGWAVGGAPANHRHTGEWIGATYRRRACAQRVVVGHGRTEV